MAAPTISTVTLSDNSIRQDEPVTVTITGTGIYVAEVIFLHPSGDAVEYVTPITVNTAHTGAEITIPPRCIPVNTYAAGDIHVIVFDQACNAFAVDQTLALAVSASLTGLIHWMCESLTIEPATTIHSYGRYSFGTAVNVAARIVPKTQKIIDKNGQDVISSAEIYVDSSATVTVNDRITLPDGTKPIILALQKFRDALGNLKLKVIYT
jgi:hypothetical protein